MSKGQEEIKVRLDNIHSIEPLLAALRTISLSNWKVILKKISLLSSYQDNLTHVYQSLNPLANLNTNQSPSENKIIILLGSNRGLCSNFNRDVIRIFQNSHYLNNGSDYLFCVFGERLRKYFERRKIKFHHYYPFPSASDLSPQLLSSAYTDIIRHDNLENISLIYNQYTGAASYTHTIKEISDLDLPAYKSFNIFKSDDYIFDTPKHELFIYLKKHLRLLSLYQAFLSSAAAEHSTRFQLMESASNNAERLAEELNIEVQTMRRQKITTEMRELAIGAGLLKRK